MVSPPFATLPCYVFCAATRGSCAPKNSPHGPTQKIISVCPSLSYPNAKLPGTNYAGSGSSGSNAASNQADGGGAADDVRKSDRIFCIFIGHKNAKIQGTKMLTQTRGDPSASNKTLISYIQLMLNLTSKLIILAKHFCALDFSIFYSAMVSLLSYTPPPSSA